MTSLTYGKKCYYLGFYNDRSGLKLKETATGQLSFFEALRAYRVLMTGASLLTVRNAFETSEIRDLVASSSRDWIFWLGLFNNNGTWEKVGGTNPGIATDAQIGEISGHFFRFTNERKVSTVRTLPCWGWLLGDSDCSLGALFIFQRFI